MCWLPIVDHCRYHPTDCYLCNHCKMNPLLSSFLKTLGVFLIVFLIVAVTVLIKVYAGSKIGLILLMSMMFFACWFAVYKTE